MNSAAQALGAVGNASPSREGRSGGAALYRDPALRHTPNGEWRRRADWSEDELGCRAWMVTKPSEARQGRWILLFTPNVAPPHPRSERLAWGLRTVSKLIDWLLHRNKPVLTGVYMGSGTIHPHTIHVPLLVCAKVQRRLQVADRVQFVAIERADGSAEAKRVRVYRRPERR